MQPPQKKVRSFATLQTIHAEQVKRLKQKHQQEVDLLEDIRTFSQQRSTIEKEYAQALCKLTQQYLTKKTVPNSPSNEEAQTSEYSGRTATAVWRHLLEETEKVGAARLSAADIYQQQVADLSRQLRANKQLIGKRVFEQLRQLQLELSQTVQEMNKVQKVYCDEEHTASDARLKAAQAIAKVQNKSTSLFTSMASLQKNSAKLNSRREQCEVKSTLARNDYLLDLEAANAHQLHYYGTDLPELMKVLDHDVHSKVSEFFTTLCKKELECSTVALECFTKILDSSNKISQVYTLQSFLQENSTLKDMVQYQFEPQDEDQISSVIHEAGTSDALEKEGKKCAAIAAKERRTIDLLQKKMQQLPEGITNGEKGTTSSTDVDGVPSSPVDTKSELDEIKQKMAGSEIEKSKAEAKLELMRRAGVDVDELMRCAVTELEAAILAEASNPHPIARSSSTNRSNSTKKTVHPPPVTVREPPPPPPATAATASTSATKSPTRGGAAQSPNANESVKAVATSNDTTYVNYDDGDDDFEEPHVALAPTGGEEELGSSSPKGAFEPIDVLGEAGGITGFAVYDFQGTSADELTAQANEALQIIAPADEDGWIKARKLNGTIGVIPSNYVQIPDSSSSHMENVVGIGQGDQGNCSFDGVAQQNDDSTQLKSAIIAKLPPPTQDEDSYWVRAICDYQARSGDELSLREGQLIKVTNKDIPGIGNGYWEGVVDDMIGIFPSMMVEELSGEDAMTSQMPKMVSSPITGGPPPYAPTEEAHKAALHDSDDEGPEPPPILSDDEESLPGILQSSPGSVAIATAEEGFVNENENDEGSDIDQHEAGNPQDNLGNAPEEREPDSLPPPPPLEISDSKGDGGPLFPNEPPISDDDDGEWRDDDVIADVRNGKEFPLVGGRHVRMMSPKGGDNMGDNRRSNGDEAGSDGWSMDNPMDHRHHPMNHGPEAEELMDLALEGGEELRGESSFDPEADGENLRQVHAEVHAQFGTNDTPQMTAEELRISKRNGADLKTDLPDFPNKQSNNETVVTNGSGLSTESTF